jgi:hypothetical protein
MWQVRALPTVPLTPPEGEQLVGGGAWKNFPALIDLHKRYPTKKWIFFNDDDTYVFVHNLLTVLSKYPADSEKCAHPPPRAPTRSQTHVLPPHATRHAPTTHAQPTRTTHAPPTHHPHHPPPTTRPR